MTSQPDVAGADLWVFAYGSLMWRPGFDFAERRRARLDGYRRGFCMWSLHYRGTKEAPGLVLALDREQGASCEGIAYRVEPRTREQVLDYLRERELISDAYLESFEQIELDCGQTIKAVTYIMNNSHHQYAGRLSQQDQAEVIARASGTVGPNDEYLFATLEHLHEIGCPDPDMDEIAALVRDLKCVTRR